MYVTTTWETAAYQEHNFTEMHLTIYIPIIPHSLWCNTDQAVWNSRSGGNGTMELAFMEWRPTMRRLTPYRQEEPYRWASPSSELSQTSTRPAYHTTANWYSAGNEWALQIIPCGRWGYGCMLCREKGQICSSKVSGGCTCTCTCTCTVDVHVHVYVHIYTVAAGDCTWLALKVRAYTNMHVQCRQWKHASYPGWDLNPRIQMNRSVLY